MTWLTPFLEKDTTLPSIDLDLLPNCTAVESWVAYSSRVSLRSRLGVSPLDITLTTSFFRLEELSCYRFICSSLIHVQVSFM